MENDFQELEKKAVKAAVLGNWNLAKEINLQILDSDPNDIDTKVRLGKAYLELRDYTKAKKCFKEVLSHDPINIVAKKNLELAKEEKHSLPSNGRFKNIIKEPTTFSEAQAQIVAKGFTASKIPMGVGLELKVLSQQTKVIYDYKNQKVELALIVDEKLQKRLKSGKEQGAVFCATFVKGVDKTMTVLINSSMPIFDGERQELKPYTKRDFLDSDNEPEPTPEEN